MLLANLVEEAVHLGLLLRLELLVQLAQAGGAVVVRVAAGYQQRRGGGGHNGARHATAAAPVLMDHLARAGEGRIVELEVHEDLGSAAAISGGGCDLAGERARGSYGWSKYVSRGRKGGGVLMDPGNGVANARLEPSCWRPALTAAAAWRDVDADRLGDGEGRDGEVADSLLSL